MTNSRFVQIHTLVSYGANNLNRDDLSRPKSMMFGPALRLRLSSQAVKRAWRLSEVMAGLTGGVRTRGLWFQAATDMVAKGFAFEDVKAHIYPLRAVLEGAKQASGAPADDVADDAAVDPLAAAGATTPDVPATDKKAGKKKPAEKKVPGPADLKGNLFYFNEAEIAFIRATLADTLDPKGTTEGKPISEKEAELRFSQMPMSPDVAMFGRMVAAARNYNVEGAVQVAHSFTVHRATIEDDYFSAVDDLADVVDISGSAHISANTFGSGLYYSYVNVDTVNLLKNLGGDKELAKAVLRALVESCTTVAPSAKQNTFAARSYSTFACIEVGSAQPRSFADAFLRPVKGDDIAAEAVKCLQDWRDELNRCYPNQKFDYVELNRLSRTGTLPELQDRAALAIG